MIAHHPDFDKSFRRLRNQSLNILRDLKALDRIDGEGMESSRLQSAVLPINQLIGQGLVMTNIGYYNPLRKRHSSCANPIVCYSSHFFRRGFEQRNRPSAIVSVQVRNDVALRRDDLQAAVSSLSDMFQTKDR